MVRERRDRTEIVADFLRHLNMFPYIKTGLVRDLCTSQSQVDKYLGRMMEGGVVKKIGQKYIKGVKEFGTKYDITEKGKMWLEKYKELCDIYTVSTERKVKK